MKVYFQQNEPNIDEIQSAMKCLKICTNLTKLWTTIADELEDIKHPKKQSAIYWKRLFCKFIRRLKAKYDLCQYICLKNPQILESYDLTNDENDFLRAWNDFEIREATRHIDLNNISDLCRICLIATNTKIMNLFKTVDNLTLLQKLNNCQFLSMEIKMDDGYPQNICSSCSILVESAFHLKTICSKTEIRLKNVFDMTKEIVSVSSVASDENLLLEKENEIERDESMEDETSEYVLILKDKLLKIKNIFFYAELK